ncbi:hypothetical protein ACKI1Z_42740, partial [Streptomyces galilaeus]|uniref:hypothetical protein n=1 Tax=Streptomyces galilaeus TaxID=33899 RepID=UPI0038F7F268
MAIGRTFQESFQKALRSLEIGLEGFHFPAQTFSTGELRQKLKRPEERRIRWIYHALRQGMPVAEIVQLTGWDPWFLENFRELIE